MKKAAIVLALLCALALLCVSCTKKAAEAPGPATRSDAGMADLEAAPAASASEGTLYVIRPEASFWSLKDGKLTWLESLSLGMELEKTGKAEKGTYKDETYDVVPVKLDTGKEGYVMVQHAVPAMSLGVVTSDLATLYKQPKDTAITSAILPRMNIVAVNPAEGSSEYYEITCYNAKTLERVEKRYLQAADVSLSVDDLNAALLLMAMRGLPKKEQRQKLLSTITTKYSATTFTTEVQQLGIALNPESMSLEPVGASYKSLGTAIVRDIPSIFGAEVKRLKQGEAADVAERTAESFSVDGETAPWLRITSPAQGWVFGAAMEAKAE